jgi:DNA-binding XRE family transcriptional regulator
MSERARDVPAPVVGTRSERPGDPAPAARKQATPLPQGPDLSFAVWLSRQLRRHHISQRELARRGGLDHSTVSRILVGARAPSWSTVQRIAHVVGFPPPHVLLGALRTDWVPGDELPGRSRPRNER